MTLTMGKNRKPSNPYVEIRAGEVFGRLTVGDWVRNVRQHELFDSTPKSYLKHGSLRECHCECGGRKLVSESALRAGFARSCGCLMRELNEKSKLDAQARRMLPKPPKVKRKRRRFFTPEGKRVSALYSANIKATSRAAKAFFEATVSGIPEEIEKARRELSRISTERYQIEQRMAQLK